MNKKNHKNLTPNNQIIQVDLFHNITWSTYKAKVFTELEKISLTKNINVNFYQIAETEYNRIGLSKINIYEHKYKYSQIFYGAYEDIPIWKRILILSHMSMRTKSDLVLLCGYNKIEYFFQAIILFFRKKKMATFIDSTIYDHRQVWWKTVVKRFFVQLVGNVFCYGERAREFAIWLGAKPENVFQRCQAAATPEGHQPMKIPQLRSAAKNSINAPLFLYVGRLSKEKGLDTLLLAFANVVKTHPNAKLRIVGGGPMMAVIEEMAERLNISSYLEIMGPADPDQVSKHYLDATAMVLPSTSEPWGLVVNEALHFGCPVIMSHKCGCAPELGKDISCGMTFASGDINDLTDKMLRAVDLWSDVKSTAEAALALISNYTPATASENIIAGIIKISSKNERF